MGKRFTFLEFLKKRSSTGEHGGEHGSRGAHHHRRSHDDELDDDDDDDESLEDLEDDNREDDLKKYITTDEDLKQRRHQHPHAPRSSREQTENDVEQFASSVFAPVELEEREAKRAARRRRRRRRRKVRKAIRKCCAPILWVLSPLINLLQRINRAAASPVGDSENLLNGTIFAASVGFMLHLLQLLGPMTNREVLHDLYCCPTSAATVFDTVMFAFNVLVVIAAYSVIWQTCAPFLIVSPFYMLYLIYAIILRHTGSTFVIIKIESSFNPDYALTRTIEQTLRLFYIMWEFCVVMAYTRQCRADRAARDMFIKQRRRRLDFISKTRRHEDRKQFLRDPIRQKTILLLTDPKRPWLKQTMAHRLAERAFSENEAIAALWGPVRQPRTSTELRAMEAHDAELARQKSGTAKKPGDKGKTQDGGGAAGTTATGKKWFGLF